MVTCFLDSTSQLGLIDYVDVIEGKMYCKCCKTWIIDEIRLELQQQFDEFEEEKAKQKEMYDH